MCANDVTLLCNNFVNTAILLFFPPILTFKPEMTPLMTFDLFSMTILYEADVNNYVKNILVKIGSIV